MQDLAKRMKLIRKKLGVTQQELADILGCTDGKVKAWEQGNTKTIKGRDSMLIANKYGFNQEWVEDGVGEMMIGQGDILLNDIAITTAMLNNNISIPYFKDMIRYSDEVRSTQNAPAFIALSPLMIPDMSTHIEAIRVAGDSMYPTIKENSTALVDKNDKEIVDGRIYFFLLCNEMYIRRIFVEPSLEKTLILSADNKMYPQLKADGDDFKIIGRVVANVKINKL